MGQVSDHLAKPKATLHSYLVDKYKTPEQMMALAQQMDAWLALFESVDDDSTAIRKAALQRTVPDLAKGQFTVHLSQLNFRAGHWVSEQRVW